MSKKIGRPTKISGTDKNFRDRPKIPGSTKISGTDQKFRGRPHFSRGRIWEKIGHSGSSKLSKCTSSNVLMGVHEKTVLSVYWGGIGLQTKSNFFVIFLDILSNFLDIFEKFRGRPKIPGSTKFSGVAQIFRGRPNFPGSPKFSGVAPVFPGDGFGRKLDILGRRNCRNAPRRTC